MIALFIVLAITLVVSAIVSAVETAITGADFVKIETMADNGDKRAKEALSLQCKRQRIISTMLFLNNLVNIVASTITTVLVTIYIKNIPLAVATAVLTFVILIFCEITPKRIANVDSEKILLRYEGLIKVSLAVFFPIVEFLSIISDTIAKFLHVDLDEKVETYTEEELKTLVDISHEQGVLEKEEKEIIQNALEFGDKTLKQIMIKNENVSYLSIDATYDDVINKFLHNEYTRYPVVDGDRDNVVGILNIKDFVKLQKIGKENYNLKELIRDPLILSQNVKLGDAFRKMQKVFTNIAIVSDDKGKNIGIVTIEDILEEVVGEIKDEFDTK